MRAIQLGVIIAAALCGLLGSALWVMAQPSPPDPEPTTGADGAESSAIAAVGLLITATVGTEEDECATTDTVQVESGDPVYYCITLHHTGIPGQDAALTQHQVVISGTEVRTQDLTLTVNPGPDGIQNTVDDTDIDFSETATVDTTSFITWTARVNDTAPEITATDRVTIDVVGPALSVAKTVGQDRDSCASARTVRVPSGEDAAFCITVVNRGDITFTNHTLVDTPLNINATFNYALAPGARLVILPTNINSILGINTSLERENITSVFNNEVTYTARAGAGSELSATGVSTASVDVGNTTVRFTKTLSTQAEVCGDTRDVSIAPGTRLYYCATIENTGVVTLTQHELTENWLSIHVEFDYPLRPGEVLQVTNDFLARHNQPIVFGPFEVHPRFGNVVNNQMNYSGSSPEGFSVSASDTTSASHPPTPTTAPTSRPDPTATYTPAATNTPTETPIPPTPTFTLTPTPTPVTPSPTPTRSYAISLLETPTPRAQSAVLPQDTSQQDTAPESTPDPFPQDQQPPAQEAALATATQIAVDATSTAMSAAETAVAESQDSLPGSPPESPPDSPLATPTVDPSISQEGEQSGLPVAPGPETPPSPEGEATTDAMAPDSPLSPPESVPGGSVPAMPTPGADDLTVLPPMITVVVATETPDVVVLVVTNTPDPAVALLPDGQRPIAYPTPTPTADFVMAAARTFDVTVTTLGWLWFLIGSLVFFVTTGIVAGLFFRQSEVKRYELSEPDYWLEEEPLADRPHTSPRPGQSADEDWPADLP